MLYARLSALMLLQYAIPGAWWPLFTLRLDELAFSNFERGLAFASSALGAVVASLIAGQVADRWIPTERCISACAGAGAVMLFLLAELTSPWAVCLVSIGIWLVMVPTMSLGVSLALTHLRDPEHQYARVRLWGTVGWVFPGLLLGLWFADPIWLTPLLELMGRTGSEVADSLRLAALLSAVLCIYALTLPHTPPSRHGKSWLAPLEAVFLMKQRSFASYCFGMLCLHLTMTFSIQQTPLLLRSLGVPLAWVSPALTIAQSMEVFFFLLLPAISLWLGLRNTLLTGLAAWCAALGIMAVGQPAWLVIASQALQGVCFCCFVVRGQVFVNRLAGPTIRASAQGLIVTLGGFGLLIGNLLVGWVREIFDGQFGPTYFVGMSINVLAAVVFFFGFGKTAQPAPITETGEGKEFDSQENQQAQLPLEEEILVGSIQRGLDESAEPTLHRK